MNRVLTLAIWLILPATTVIAVSSNVQGGADPLTACINATVVKLDGVPRTGITASLGESQADGNQRVNWQAQDGSSGFCRVGAAGQVTQVKVEVAVRETNSVRALTPAVSGAAAGTPVWVSTTAGAINLRSSPGGEIVGSAANGSQLTVTGKTTGDWVEVTGGQWVSQYLLITFNPTPSAASESAQASPSPTQIASGAQSAQIATGDGGGVNVRRGPGGEVLYGLADGSTVTLTGQKDSGWVEIQDGGWVSEAYLR
jgi:uncharacterized protein YgiM (DUF1202 family)